MYIMEEEIKRYLRKKFKKLKKRNIYLEEEEIDKLAKKYAALQLNIREIMKMIDKDEEKFLENYRKTQELREQYINKIEENKELEDIPLEYAGVNLDKETAEIMKVEETNDAKDLKDSLTEVSKLDPKLEEMNYTDKQILNAEKEIDKLYQATRDDKSEYQRDNSSKVKKKMEYLEDIGKLTEEEKDTVGEIVEESTSTDEIIEKADENFEEEDAHSIYDLLEEETPINETEIEKTEENNINPFDETPVEEKDEDEEDLEDMFIPEEDEEKTYEEEVEVYEEEKPKVFTKRRIEVEENEDNNEEGSVGLLSLSVILSTILVILIGLIITITILR